MHLPRRTLRLRLTLLYGGLFLASGAALLAITYVLVVHNTSGFIFNGQNGSVGSISGTYHAAPRGRSGDKPQLTARGPRAAGLTPKQLEAQAHQLEAQARQQHDSVLHQLLIQSGIALAAMALASIALGWIIAGRVLRPLRTITTAARDISATTSSRSSGTRSTGSSGDWRRRSTRNGGSWPMPPTSCEARSRSSGRSPRSP
jgi:hypothetical protein